MERGVLTWHQKSGIIGGERRKFPGFSSRDLRLVSPCAPSPYAIG